MLTDLALASFSIELSGRSALATSMWLAVMCSIYLGEERLRSLKLLCSLRKKFPLQTCDFGLEMAQAGTWGFPLLQKVLKLCILELRYLERNQNPKFSTRLPQWHRYSVKDSPGERA